jgi:AcrR family transcriptional regulator
LGIRPEKFLQLSRSGSAAYDDLVASTAGTRRRAVRPAEKFDERRNQLAESALQTLGEVGYARASLREIANNSPFSHGVVHYYFQDKLELVIYSVRHYKARCVTRYDSVVQDSTTADELLDRFADKLAETIRDEAAMHRLWYDLRTQSMFEPSLREAVSLIDGTLQEMIWRVVSRYADLAGARPALSPALAYGMLDGVFQQALLGYGDDGDAALDELAAAVRTLMPSTITRTDPADRPGGSG